MEKLIRWPKNKREAGIFITGLSFASIFQCCSVLPNSRVTVESDLTKAIRDVLVMQ
jgi:hypothetical protein